jgi:hypothetical protein
LLALRGRRCGRSPTAFIVSSFAGYETQAVQHGLEQFMDRIKAHLLEGLKQALAEPGEQRLFRSGKLPGLFRSRHGASSEAARQALHEGLLHVIRTEPNGKLQMDWVRPTPQAVEFLHAHESPAAALKELHAELYLTQQGLPAWVSQLQQRLETLAGQLSAEVQSVARRLNSLSQRVEQAIARIEAARPHVSEQLAELVPWANAAVCYLDRRLETGEGPCALSELFAALRTQQSALTVAEYHAGLRRLFDRGVVRLLTFAGTNGLPEPEYALLDGVHTYYFATRGGK